MSAVVHPKHYNSHPSGIECIDLVENMMFNFGNALKYIWRYGEKGNPVEDLNKAIWYLEREMDRRRIHRAAFSFIAVDIDLASKAINSVEGFEQDAYIALLSGAEVANAINAIVAIKWMLAEIS